MLAQVLYSLGSHEAIGSFWTLMKTPDLRREVHFTHGIRPVEAAFDIGLGSLPHLDDMECRSCQESLFSLILAETLPEVCQELEQMPTGKRILWECDIVSIQLQQAFEPFACSVQSSQWR